LFFALILSTTSNTFASTFFFDPPGPVDIAYQGYVGNGSWDLSGLTIAGTPDGLKISGTLTVTAAPYIQGGEADAFRNGLIFISLLRSFSSGTVPALLTSHVNGSVTASGGLFFQSVGNSSRLFPTAGNVQPCLADAFVGGESLTPIPSGPFADTENVICANANLPFDQITQMLAVVVFTGPEGGTGVIDFQNSALSEVTEAAVPEPSTFMLLGTGLLVFSRRHWYRPGLGESLHPEASASTDDLQTRDRPCR
jgi:hypothetical protein